jgi:hypothetical protein
MQTYGLVWLTTQFKGPAVTALSSYYKWPTEHHQWRMYFVRVGLLVFVHFKHSFRGRPGGEGVGGIYKG